MNCAVCAKDVPDGAKFCPWCGKEPSSQKVDAAWVAGMQEEISELRRAEKLFQGTMVGAVIFGGIFVSASILLPLWFPTKFLSFLIFGIVLIVVGLACFPFAYRYAKKREQLIKSLKTGRG